MSGLQSRFDWYSATFENDEFGGVAEHLAGVTGTRISLGRGRMGYAQCATLESDEESIAKVYMHSARAGETHVSISGNACDLVVPLVREFWPDHRVARVDSAMDFEADFEALDRLALGFAHDRGLKHRLVTDSDGGATRYLGATSSEVMVRVYKKTEQLRAIHPHRAAEVPEGLVRAEIQARPGTKVKGVVAGMSADDIWGLGAWTKDFAETFLDLEAERVPTHFRRETDWDRALHFLGVQYGPSIKQRVDDVGTAVALSEVLDALGLPQAYLAESAPF